MACPQYITNYAPHTPYSTSHVDMYIDNDILTLGIIGLTMNYGLDLVRPAYSLPS